MRKQSGTMIALVIILGALALTPVEVKAGSPSCNPAAGSGAEDKCRGGGEYKKWCEWHFGPYEPTCCPTQCADGFRPPAPAACVSQIPASGSLSDKSSGMAKRAVMQPETTLRRVASELLSLVMLIGAIGGVIISIRKLLRPASVPLYRRWRRLLPYPRVEFASLILAAAGLASGAWLLTQGGAQASSASPVPLTAASSLRARASAAAPQFSSAFQFGGTGKTQIGGTAIDGQGHTYVAGAFFGSITFNTQPQATTLTSTEAFDVFVAKFDPAGQPLWARMANGATGLIFSDPETGDEDQYSLDGALALAADAQGNVYIGGGFVKSLFFKNAEGDTVATLGDDAESESDEINLELFVAKYDADGALVWARGGDSGALDDPEAEEDLDSGVNGVTDIVVDNAGNPYVSGTFSGTHFLGQEVTPDAPDGGQDILLSRLDPATGSPVWVSTPGSAATDASSGLAIDDSANLYLIGEVGATLTFPTQPQATTMLVDDEFGDAFVAKYDRNGSALWAKQIAGDQPIEGEHIAVSGAGDLYLTGAFAGDAEFDSIKVIDPAGGAGSSGFLAKYTGDGNALWVRIFGHFTGDDSTGDVLGNRVAVDDAGAPYVLGTFEGEATFGIESVATQQTLTSASLEDNFITHYDAAGNYQWVKQLVQSEASNDSLGGSDEVTIEVVPLRIVYNGVAGALTVTGDFLGTLALDSLTLDAGSGIRSYIATLPLQQTPASSSTVQFSPAVYTVGEGAGSIQITATRSGDVSGAASVDYATSDGTASQKSDYQLALGTLHFAPGETSESFRALIVDDGFVEGAETINLTLSNPTGTAALGNVGTASITITDNDTTPGATNPIDNTQLFVRQHYLDFLNREPDTAGLHFWVNNMESCGADAQCREVKRINTSAAFFLSIEFQETGFYVVRIQRAAFGRHSDTASARIPYQQFIRDTRELGDGVVVGQPNWEQQLQINKQAYAEGIVTSAEFAVRFPLAQSAADYVNALYASAGVTPTEAERQAAINAFGAGGNAGRAAALTKVADSASLRQAEFNPAFVLMEYFGYLRRNPTDAPDNNSDAGYQFWLTKLNQFNGDFIRAEMVKAFISSTEYRQRFGP